MHSVANFIYPNQIANFCALPLIAICQFQVEALCASVQDASVLVQRSALDLLLLGFPMHNSQLTRPDMIKIITAVIKVVLRRDMSLNRRLYAWLLGADASGAPIHSNIDPRSRTGELGRQDSASTQGSDQVEMDYFHTYSRDMLILAVKNCIQEVMPPAVTEMGSPEGGGKSGNLRPFKILISLLDKPEIGSAILEDILVEIFRCMYRECMSVAGGDIQSTLDHNKDSPHQSNSVAFYYRENSVSSLQGSAASTAAAKKKEVASKKDEKTVTGEIVKTANLLFGSFEPHFIWDFIGRKFEKACQECETSRDCVLGKGEMGLVELCYLVGFLLDKVSLVGRFYLILGAKSLCK